MRPFVKNLCTISKMAHAFCAFALSMQALVLFCLLSTVGVISVKERRIPPCVENSLSRYTYLESHLNARKLPVGFKMSGFNCFGTLTVKEPDPLQFTCDRNTTIDAHCRNQVTNGTAIFTIFCHVSRMLCTKMLYSSFYLTPTWYAFGSKGKILICI